LRICEAAGHEKLDDRLRGINDTIAAVKRKQAATGFPKLAEIIGQRYVDAACKWLKIDNSGSGSGIGDTSAWKAKIVGRDPPTFFVSLSEDVTVEVSHDTLLNPPRMAQEILRQTRRVALLPKKKFYERDIAAMCETATKEDCTSDVERETAIIDLVDGWLAMSKRGSTPADLYRGMPVLNENNLYVRLDTVRNSLKEQASCSSEPKSSAS
jgi:hypothetical protein